NIDQSMLTGIDQVRRTSDSITRQSLKAIEGLSNQTDVLRGVSESLVQQISGVTTRFDNQGQSIVSAANALEGATLRIDSTLQKRQAELNETLQRMSGKAQQLDDVMRSIQTPTDAQSHMVTAELERLRAQADAQTMRTIEDMRSRGSGAPQDMAQHLAAEDPLVHAVHLPMVHRESAEAMRSALNDQLRALEQLSSLAARERGAGYAPSPLAPGAPLSLSGAYAAQVAGVPPPPPPQPQLPPDASERWSLGDLLARASRDDDGTV